MRFTRAGLSLGLLMLGKEAVQPATIVHSIQIRRRKLRAIKYQGLKVIRTRNSQHEKSSKSSVSMYGRMTGVFSKMLCTTSTITTDDGIRMVVGKKNKSSIGVQQSSSSKRRHDEGEESEGEESKMKFAELLDKYVNEGSDDDSNFEVQVKL